MAVKSPLTRWLTRVFGHRLEAVLVYALYGLFRIMPLDAASALGGWLLRCIGPLSRGHRTAARNLQRALPELSAAQHAAVLSGMWDNLGRVLGEYAHLAEIWRGRIDLVGIEHLQACADQGRPAMLFSAHLGNWETAQVITEQIGLPVTVVYRRPNNPYVDRLILRTRSTRRGRMAPKGREGSREVVATLRRGGTVGMLIDQKLNDGLAVPFFGRPAMTTPASVQLSYRYNCAVMAVKTERLHGAHFRVTVSPPVSLPDSGDKAADLLAGLTLLNHTIEGWVRQAPQQWLWLHRRWPD